MKQLCGFVGSKALLFCVDYTRLIDTAEHMGYTYDVTGIVPLVTGSIDTILMAQTAAIAATSLGIDSLFTNGVSRLNLHQKSLPIGLQAYTPAWSCSDAWCRWVTRSCPQFLPSRECSSKKSRPSLLIRYHISRWPEETSCVAQSEKP